ncbi:hypothetical protein L228DRAFT_284955 [Xylona heveae TC161]|uniref:Uncharacterized protein n=1 Tax=Xylona heveae (strain CBS 132557 / TC161) TaxID=1328760 RepID=A0A165ABS2_XYLHT|nr:hypothetical protein L228DRAFT_284955 [Xylona heveae TC161]KZF20224.1 hypothetical protein L228DRAFT_284955 [Xylona heveae TC161]
MSYLELTGLQGCIECVTPDSPRQKVKTLWSNLLSYHFPSTGYYTVIKPASHKIDETTKDWPDLTVVKVIRGEKVPRGNLVMVECKRRELDVPSEWAKLEQQETQQMIIDKMRATWNDEAKRLYAAIAIGLSVRFYALNGDEFRVLTPVLKVDQKPDAERIVKVVEDMKSYAA